MLRMKRFGFRFAFLCTSKYICCIQASSVPPLSAMSVDFNSSQLVSEIVSHEPMPLPSRTALKAIGSQLRLYCLTSDRKTFTFQILGKEIPNGSAYVTLRVMKGSLHTLLWSTFARFDDEYVLYYHMQLEDLRDHLDRVYLLWSVKGVDSVNAKISLGLIDWFLLRKIQLSMKITTVGVLAFTKMLGRFLLSVPNFIKNKQYLPPMPATFMFNYLMIVCYCPFELSVDKLPQFLYQTPEAASGISNKMLLQTFIQPNGSGAWIPGFLPVHLPAGGYALQSKYYFYQQPGLGPGAASGGGGTSEGGSARQGHAASVIEGGASGGETGGDATYGRSGSRAGTQSSEQGGQTRHAVTPGKESRPGSVGDAEVSSGTLRSTARAPPGAVPAPPLLSHCDLLLQETAVRVVQLLPHILGVRGMIVLLEFVHNRRWSAIQRFVALDAYKVCLAIQAAGQVPHALLSHIEIFDEQGWWLLNTTIAEAPYIGTPAGLDLSRSSPVGHPSLRGPGTLQHREASISTPTRPVASVSRDDGELPVESTSLFSTPGLLFDEAAMDFGDGAQAIDQAANSDDSDNVARGAGGDMENDGDSDSADFLLMDMVSPGTAPAAFGPAPSVGGKRTAPSASASAVPGGGRASALAGDGVIDFANSCEWGAPCKSHKTVEFYAQLIRELQGQQGGQGDVQA